MDFAAIGTVIALLGLLGTIAGLVFALGKRDARLDNLESRSKEDREKNAEQHKEFYGTNAAVIALVAKVDGLTRSVEKLEEGIAEILRLMPRRGADT